MPDDAQAALLDKLRSADKPPSTLAHLLGPDSSNQTRDPLDRLTRPWHSASPELRARFVAWLKDGGWLDTQAER